MKNTVIAAVLFFLVSCGGSNPEDETGRYIIETTVQLQPESTLDVLALFAATNPDLVKGEPDWIRASFSAVEGDIVVVRAEWKSVESYQKFSSSEKFKETMSVFGKHFAGKPEVVISRVLFEM